MKNIVLLLIAIICVHSACKKPKKVLIEGTVTDIKTSEMISGVLLSLYETAPGLFGNDEYLLETVTSDGNGNFEFNAQKKSDRTNGYFIKTSRDNYFGDYKMLINKDEISLGNTNTKNMQIYPKAYIRVHIKNTQPFDNTDYLNITIPYRKDPELTLALGVFKGVNIDTTIIQETIGNQYGVLNLLIIKNIN